MTGISRRLAAIAFLALIALPGGVHIARGSASVLSGEKRMAASLPAPPGAGRPWPVFAAELETYLKDNFGFRQFFLSGYHLIKAHLFRDYYTGSAAVLFGTDGWLFYTAHRQIEGALGRITLSAAQKEYWAGKIKAEHDVARRSGIPYVAVLAPNKSSVYPEYLPAWARTSDGPSTTDQVLTYARARYPEVAILDLRAPIRDAKTMGLLYGKTDVHWTTIAGWRATKEIVDHARGLLPAIPEMRPWSEYRVASHRARGGDLTARLNIRPYVRTTDFGVSPLGEAGFYATPDSPYMRLPTLSPDHPTFTYASARSEAPRVLVFRNSFFNALLPYFPAYFSETVVLWRDLEAQYLDLVKPDLVIHQYLEMELIPSSPS